jgi:hypothetical protein
MKYPSDSYVASLIASIPPMASSPSAPSSPSSTTTNILRTLLDAFSILHTPSEPDKQSLYIASSAILLQLYADLRELNTPNPDVTFLTLSSLLLLHPWKYFDYPSTLPLHPSTSKTIMDIFNASLPSTHLGINHLYIHYIEMANNPEAALPSCRILDERATNLPHLQHMSSHITLQLGNYHHVVAANKTAIASDLLYLRHFSTTTPTNPFPSTPRNGFYVGYIAHDYHMCVYGACLGGYEGTALATARDLLHQVLPTDLLQQNEAMLVTNEMFLSLERGVMMRFGRWGDIVAATSDISPNSTPDQYFHLDDISRRIARVVALVNTERVSEARALFDTIAPLLATIKPLTRYLHNNTGYDILAVEHKRSEAELLFFENDNLDQAFDAFEESVKLDDQLNYDEPWGVLVPTRHSYAALLFDAATATTTTSPNPSYVNRARELYEQDLKVHPKNIWSVQGLLKICSFQQANLGNDDKETIQTIADMKAIIEERRGGEFVDVEIKASCACARSAKE